MEANQKLDMESLIEQITQKVMSQLTNDNMLSQTKRQTMTDSDRHHSGSLQPRSLIITGPEIARMIDHTLLKPDCTKNEIVKLCEEARTNGFATVCVNPYWVPTAARELAGTKVGVTTVVGFPLGCTSTFAKISEARDAIASGATEIDMVMNISAMKSGDLDAVRKDIEGVVLACRGQAIVKVIIETCYLTDEEKKKACVISKMAGADFVKTSTGFGSGGATAEDIALMREVVGPEMGVKASGGVRDIDTARKLIASGANRIGASSSVELVKGERGSGDY